MILELYYKWRHPDKAVPYSYRRTVCQEILHLTRKFICQNIAPHCVTNFMRVNLYRACGFKIGKGTFIGMKCYLDDLCYDKLEIGANVTISYGVYFACHGRKQGHHRIEIKDGAYIGMCSCLIAPKNIVIGERAIVGAMTLVNKDVPSGGTVVGVPCRSIGYF